MARLALTAVRRSLSDAKRSFEIEVGSFDLVSGDRRAIVGRSGSGKTSLLDMLALANAPDSAEGFELEDEAGRNWPEPFLLGAAELGQLRARNFGYVLQTNPLFPFLTLRENARLGQQLARRPDEAYLDALLEELGLAHMPPGTRVADLSLGQRQRLAIARALAHRPAFVLCDEPTAALDDETAASLMRLLMRLAGQMHAAVLIVTHDAALALAHGCTLHEMVPRPDGRPGSVLVPKSAP